MRQNRWHSENQFKPTPRLLTRENHEIQQPIGKYEWMFAIAAIFISIVIGAVIIRFVFKNLSRFTYQYKIIRNSFYDAVLKLEQLSKEAYFVTVC